MNEPTIVDAQGLSCPQPVLLTKQAMQKVGTGVIHVIVDSGTSRDNCARIAQKNGWSVDVQEQTDGSFKLELSK